MGKNHSNFHDCSFVITRTFFRNLILALLGPNTREIAQTHFILTAVIQAVTNLFLHNLHKRRTVHYCFVSCCFHPISVLSSTLCEMSKSFLACPFILNENFGSFKKKSAKPIIRTGVTVPNVQKCVMVATFTLYFPQISDEYASHI